MKTNIYHCRTLSEAKQKAEIYYISNPKADGITHTHATRKYKVSKRGAIIAVFNY